MTQEFQSQQPLLPVLGIPAGFQSAPVHRGASAAVGFGFAASVTTPTCSTIASRSATDTASAADVDSARCCPSLISSVSEDSPRESLDVAGKAVTLGPPPGGVPCLRSGAPASPPGQLRHEAFSEETQDASLSGAQLEPFGNWGGTYDGHGQAKPAPLLSPPAHRVSESSLPLLASMKTTSSGNSQLAVYQPSSPSSPEIMPHWSSERQCVSAQSSPPLLASMSSNDGRSEITVYQPSQLAYRPSPIANQWLAYTSHCIQRAESDGLVKTNRVSMWNCPYCEKDVHEGHLEDHLASTKHTRYRNWHIQSAILQEKKNRGELRDWMELRNGDLFCKLCNKPASQEHLLSRKHCGYLEFHQRFLDTIGPFTGAASGDAAKASVTWATNGSKQWGVREPFPIPGKWGDPAYFEWRPASGMYHCLLCSKTADTQHVLSRGHAQQIQMRASRSENRTPSPPRVASSCAQAPSSSALQRPMMPQRLPWKVPPPPPPPLQLCGSDATRLSTPPPPLPPPPPPLSSPRAPLIAVPAAGSCATEQDPAITMAASSLPDDPWCGEEAAPTRTSTDKHVRFSRDDLLASYDALDESARIALPLWKRYCLPEDANSFWWWRECDGEFFFESETASWTHFQDEETAFTYWWKSDAEWFWSHTGTTDMHPTKVYSDRAWL